MHKLIIAFIARWFDGIVDFDTNLTLLRIRF